MNVDGTQRWRSGRASYRPAGEVIDTRRFEVAAIDGPGADNIARAFVVAHHYSASYPAARERIGLYRGGALVGVAGFSHPAQDKVLGCLPCPKAEAAPGTPSTSRPGCRGRSGRSRGRSGTPATCVTFSASRRA